jgi:hypothetical protein
MDLSRHNLIIGCDIISWFSLQSHQLAEYTVSLVPTIPGIIQFSNRYKYIVL